MSKNLLFIFLLFPCFAFGQTNLVPNPSFEIYSACPSNLGQVPLANGWNEVFPSPDYYHKCSASINSGIPNNFFGYQNTISPSDSAYCGFSTYGPQAGCLNNNCAEIIGCQLISPLTIGQKYYVSFYASPSWGFTKSFSNKLGFLFSTVQYAPGNPPPQNNFAHVYTNSIITDTTNWTYISGSFIADSTYGFLSMGNFFDRANTSVIYYIPATSSWDSAAYYYIDRICVSTDSLTCGLGVGIQETKHLSNLIIYPNPAKEKITIYFSFSDNQKKIIYIYNLFGEMKRQIILTQNPETMDLSDMTNGIYVIKSESANNIFTQKIIINK